MANQSGPSRSRIDEIIAAAPDSVDIKVRTSDGASGGTARHTSSNDPGSNVLIITINGDPEHVDEIVKGLEGQGCGCGSSEAGTECDCSNVGA